MPQEILNYISKEEYTKKTKSLKNGQTLCLHKDKNINIDIIKNGRKIYTVISHFSDEKTATEAITDMYNASNLQLAIVLA